MLLEEKVKELKEFTTKTGFVIKESWCRKCAKMLPATEFYEAVDAGFIDTQGLMSVCKNHIQSMYDEVFLETQSMEKAIHKLCTSLNVRFSNEACSAAKEHINTLLQNGKNVTAIFSIYKMKLTATKKSMTKSGVEDMTYEDIGTIFTTEVVDTTKIPIPKEVIDFWGKDVLREDIEFLEKEYTNFRATHKSDTYAEMVLLKQVCYTLLSIKRLRLAGDDSSKLVKELQDLMKNLAISPNIANATTAANKGSDTFGLWIEDIEREEPAQWLKTDPRGDMYRDVGNVEEYFQKYIVRPLKNFIMNSRDFNVDSEEVDEVSQPSEGIPDYTQIDEETGV
jgi:hypothetical protein